MREAACLTCGHRMPSEQAPERVAAGDGAPGCRRRGGRREWVTRSVGPSLVLGAVTAIIAAVAPARAVVVLADQTSSELATTGPAAAAAALNPP